LIIKINIFNLNKILSIKCLQVELNIQSEDKQIIDSFLDGDKSAFNIIVLKYQKRVYWTIRRMVVDHDDADDITQEVFVKLYKSLKDFRGDLLYVL